MLRRIVVESAEVLLEAGSELEVPVRQTWAAAVVCNPWIGGGTTSDLITPPRSIAARLAQVLSDRLLASLGPEQVAEAFGKGAIIGEAGELEHGAALTHTPYFAGNLRTFLGGTAVIAFADARARAGEPLVIPLCDRTTGVRRDYYQAVRMRIPDAPRPDEIVIGAAISTGTRPFPRVGDRTTDQPLDQTLLDGAFA